MGGSFDGDGYVISNLTIDTAGASTDYLGLFGKIEGVAARVSNLGIVNCNITGGINSNDLGGLCGYNFSGTISNCSATALVTGNDELGGLCGSNDHGTITNCHSGGSVDGDDDLGGLCGENFFGTIANCYSDASVNGDDDLGGLCGENWGTISNCYSGGSVTGGAGSFILGGLCGYNGFGTITNCYSDSSVDGDESLGGLCGYNSDIITNCYATGSVTGGSYLGGLCGVNKDTITNCYATGSVTGGDSSNDLGGLCGYNNDTITNCYATGSVTGDHSLGGLCGENRSGTITNCFWDTDTSNMTAGIGSGTSFTGVDGMTTSQMQIQTTFTDPPASWDFVTTWWNNEGRDYPRLAWQPFGDLNNDSHVNLVDFATLAGQWQLQRLLWDIAPPNPDGAVNLLDFAAFVKDWTGSAEDFIELAVFAGQWLQPGASNADIAPVNNADGVVDILDLQALAEQWPEGPQE